MLLLEISKRLAQPSSVCLRRDWTSVILLHKEDPSRNGILSPSEGILASEATAAENAHVVAPLHMYALLMAH